MSYLRIDQLGQEVIDAVFATDVELANLNGVQRATIINRIANLTDEELITLGIPKTTINGHTGVIGKTDLVAVIKYATQLEGGLLSAADKIKIDNFISVPPHTGVTGVGKTLVATSTDNVSIWEATQFEKVFGDGLAKIIAINHNLNTRNLDVLIRQNNYPYRKIECDVYFTTTDTITLSFGDPPGIDEYLITIIKK